MKSPIRLLVVLAAMAATALAAATPAQASGSAGGAVFVQTNDPAGNSIDAFHRNGDGTLTFLTSYPTGGLGGRELSAGSDPIATQGSLRLDEGLLLAVNPGSNTVSVLAVNGDKLALTQVVASGGLFPASIATHGDLVYVVDAGGQGSVSGFRLAGGKLHPIEGSTRSLGLPNGNPPAFLASPAQVGFTPDGEHLIVTTKKNFTVDVFSVNPDGRLSATPVKNPSTQVPFAWVFDSAGRIVLNSAGTSSLQTLTVNEDNTITPVSAPVSDNQGGLCWVTQSGGYLYTSNTGTGNVSQFQVLADGTVVLVNAIAASSIPGAIDSAAAGAQTLYVQSGLSGTVHAFAIGAGGALTLVQVAAVPDGGSQEGIVVI
jgi:6-phosphogluconolactonase (cycloisomerase 2 family)